MSKRNLEQFAQQIQDPYELIRKLRGIINAQNDTIDEYKTRCDNLIYDKTIAIRQLAANKKIIDGLKDVEDEKTPFFTKQNQVKSSTLKLIRLENSRYFHQNLSQSPSSKLFKSQLLSKNQIFKSKVSIKSPQGNYSLKSQEKQSTEYIPQQIKFSNRQRIPDPSIMNQTATIDSVSHQFGQNLVEDFMVIGPDIGEFKKLRQQKKGSNEFKVKSQMYFNLNKTYKKKKPQFLTQISARAFSQGITARKKLLQNIQEFKQEIPHIPDGRMSQDFFIFTLKGDQESTNSSTSRQMLNSCNPLRTLFIVCMKLTDFISVRDEKHYQRKEHQIWQVPKIYALLTYYPFMDVHLNLLARVQAIMRQNLLRRVFGERDNILLWQLSRNVYDLQKNESIRQMLAWFLNKKPDYNQICFYDGYYFGSLPNFGFNCEYALARFVCPIFFSTFSFQEMLLLVTSVFCQKTIVFISNEESVSTLCSLFLVSVLSPFVYRSTLLLNCDSQKMNTMIFEFPFSMISSIKKEKDNIGDIISAFALSNLLHFKGQNQTSHYILIDIDSNTILYDTDLLKLFEDIIFNPGKQINDAYLGINSAHSKSFTFPKKMPVQIKSNFRNDYEKNEEEKRKIIKGYRQKIESNTIKTPSFQCSEKSDSILELLVDYIRTFTIEKDRQQEYIAQPKEMRLEWVRSYLLEKHKDKGKLIEVMLKSQLYADYMDSIAQI